MRRGGFWAGLGVGVAAAALAVGLSACQVTKDITVPANAEASCSVVTGPGGRK